jgi:hypothetical protein
VRGDGTVVLYDWELFRRGVPATDPAITVPGLGDTAKYADAAACYLEEWSDIGGLLPWSHARLARDIALAKVEAVVSLLHAHATTAVHVPEATTAWLSDEAPARMESLV